MTCSITFCRSQLKLASVDGSQKELAVRQKEDQILELKKEQEDSEGKP